VKELGSKAVHLKPLQFCRMQGVNPVYPYHVSAPGEILRPVAPSPFPCG
jgi:hypothetical protein